MYSLIYLLLNCWDITNKGIFLRSFLILEKPGSFPLLLEHNLFQGIAVHLVTNQCKPVSELTKTGCSDIVL